MMTFCSKGGSIALLLCKKLIRLTNLISNYACDHRSRVVSHELICHIFKTKFRFHVKSLLKYKLTTTSCMGDNHLQVFHLNYLKHPALKDKLNESFLIYGQSLSKTRFQANSPEFDQGYRWMSTEQSQPRQIPKRFEINAFVKCCEQPSDPNGRWNETLSKFVSK
jgi:hypothetical protein